MKTENKQTNQKIEKVLWYICVTLIILLVLLMILVPIIRKKITQKCNDIAMSNNSSEIQKDDRNEEAGPVEEDYTAKTIKEYQTESSGVKISEVKTLKRNRQYVIATKLENVTQKRIEYIRLKVSLVDATGATIYEDTVLVGDLEASSETVVETTITQDITKAVNVKAEIVT